MTWNYRVIVTDGEFGIHEVYYDQPDCSSKQLSWTESPVHPGGGSKIELKQDIMYMLEALNLPALKESEDGKSLEEYHG